MYHHHAQEEKQAAIDLYISNGFSPTTVKRTLGYPSRSTLSHWYHDYLQRGYVRGLEHWTGKLTEDQKKAADEDYLANGRNILRTVNELGYPSRTLLSQWIDELAPGMRKTTKPHRRFTDDERMSILIESATAPTVKQVIEDHDIDEITFYNWRKSFLGEEAQNVIDDINQDGLLSEIDSLKEEIATLEAEARSHKIEVAVWKGVAELEKNSGIDSASLSNKKKRKWSSYAGEIGGYPKNLIGRDFHADAPNELWLTDITQFTLPNFKCYLSPVIDCFDGKVVSQRISLHLNAELANSMLDDAIATLTEDEHPIYHNDCGCHYRWAEGAQ